MDSVYIDPGHNCNHERMVELMNPILKLTEGIENLWYMTYGIVAGWGLTFTLVVVAIVLLAIRTINLQRRVDQLESRLIHAERDYNLSINQHKGK